MNFQYRYRYQVVGNVGQRFPTIEHENGDIRCGKTLGKPHWTPNERAALYVVLFDHQIRGLRHDHNGIYEELRNRFPDFQRGQLGVDHKTAEILKEVNEDITNQQQAAIVKMENQTKTDYENELRNYAEQVKIAEKKLTEERRQSFNTQEEAERKRKQEMTDLKKKYENQLEQLSAGKAEMKIRLEEAFATALHNSRQAGEKLAQGLREELREAQELVELKQREYNEQIAENEALLRTRDSENAMLKDELAHKQSLQEKVAMVMEMALLAAKNPTLLTGISMDSLSHGVHQMNIGNAAGNPFQAISSVPHLGDSSPNTEHCSPARRQSTDIVLDHEGQSEKQPSQEN